MTPRRNPTVTPGTAVTIGATGARRGFSGIDAPMEEEGEGVMREKKRKIKEG
jgi:hypothetical protein